MTLRTVSLLGGPGSGKSTYLGAVLDELLSEKADRLTIREEAADMAVITQLTEPLLQGEYPTRTAAAQRLACELHLGYRDGRDAVEPFTLRVGDYAGEEVERLFNDRVEGWSSQWRSRAGADVLLLALRPAAIVPLPRMGRAAPTPRRPKQAFGADPTSVFGPGLADGEIPERHPAAPDEPIRIPVTTVLAMIELLQFIRHARGLAPGQRPRDGRLRIGVMLTAWDAIATEWQTRPPAAYLAQHVPLLVDFMKSNFLAEDVMCFGVSATGGDLKDGVHRARYIETPGGSVAWADAQGRVQQRPDLALPLRWALFGDASMRHDL
jgi:hypothetical protein